jgi:hypothetical protein
MGSNYLEYVLAIEIRYKQNKICIHVDIGRNNSNFLNLSGVVKHVPNNLIEFSPHCRKLIAIKVHTVSRLKHPVSLPTG